MIAAVLVFTFISVMAGAIGSRLRSRPSVQIYMNKIAGVIFAAQRTTRDENVERRDRPN